MADFYCDHGAYASALGTTPTWGTPQEGDGTATTVAAASGIASILFNAIPTTGAYTLCGASVSVTGVLSAASTAAAATALAANINAATATVSSSAASGTPQLRNLVFARVDPGDANAVQIMMRVGSLTLNHATNSNVAQVHTFNGTAPTVVQFIGGTGGCWGWALNTAAAIGVSSSIAIRTYGALLHMPMVNGVTSLNDMVWVRTGTNTVLTINGVGSTTISVAIGLYNRRVTFDSNTKWTSDGTAGVFKLVLNGGSAFGAVIALSLGNGFFTQSYEAVTRGGFEIEMKGTLTGNGGQYNGVYYSGGGSSGNWPRTRVGLRHVKFSDTNVSASGANYFFLCGAYQDGHLIAVDCDYAVTTARSVIPLQFLVGDFSSAQSYTFIGCAFNPNISGLSYPGDLVAWGVSVSGPLPFFVKLHGCSFAGYSPGYKLFNSWPSAWGTNIGRMTLDAEQCSGLAMPASYVGAQSGTVGVSDPATRRITLNNLASTTAPGFRIETLTGVFEWVPDNSPAFPTLAATMLGTGVPWSARLVWIQSVAHSAAYRFSTPPLKALNQNATAVRTLTLELMMPTGVTTGLEISFTYVDSSGIARTQTTTTLATSAASWTGAGSWATHEARKATVTTAYSVLLNSEVSATVSLVAPCPTSTASVFIDPEVAIT